MESGPKSGRDDVFGHGARSLAHHAIAPGIFGGIEARVCALDEG
jgi:hypothetical protein